MSGDHLLQDAQLMWDKAPVPNWAYSQDAVKRTHDFFQHGADTLINIVSKPAWKYAYCANIFLWFFAAAYPGLVWWASRCDGHNFAKAPPWLWAVYVLPLAGAMYCEVEGHRLLLPAVIKVLGPYKLCGFKLPFTTWFVGAMCISIGSHADLATSGFFLGRLLKTESCRESWVPQIWSRVVSHSKLRFLPSLAEIGVCLWILMFTQLWRGLALGVPRKFEDLKELLDTEDAYKAVETAAYYHPLSYNYVRTRGESSHTLAVSDLLTSLSDPGRMVLISFRNTSYITIGFKDMIRIFPSTRRSVGHATDTLAHRVLVNFVFESSFQPNLQASALAVSYAATRQLDPETMVSLVLTFTLTAYNVYSAARTMIMYNSLLRPRLRQSVEFEVIEDMATMARLNWSVAVFVIACILCAFFSGYAITKTSMAAVVCTDAVWNMGGCVNITKLLSSLNSTDHAP